MLRNVTEGSVYLYNKLKGFSFVKCKYFTVISKQDFVPNFEVKFKPKVRTKEKRKKKERKRKRKI